MKKIVLEKKIFLIHEIFPHPMRFNENLVIFNKECKRINIDANFFDEQKKVS